MTCREENLDCQTIRETMQQGASYIFNTTVFLDVADEGYEDQQNALNQALAAVGESFENRPIDCQMQRTGEEAYECLSCQFWIDIQ